MTLAELRLPAGLPLQHAISSAVIHKEGIIQSLVVNPTFPRINTIFGVSLLIASMIAILPIRSAEAFKPRTRAGTPAGDSTHQSITEDAIKKLDAEFFPSIRKLTTGMEKAIEEIVTENARVDLSLGFFSPKHHFDDETFASGQKLTADLFRVIKSDLNDKKVKEARGNLGEALHAIQDFYSHSNWIEKGNSAPNSTLGVPGGTIGPVAGKNEVTCRDCTPCTDCTDNITTNNITSGYFAILSGSSKPNGKCSHGGPGDRTSNFPAKGGINKDTSQCDDSPHSSLHSAAGTVAGEATKSSYAS